MKAPAPPPSSDGSATATARPDTEITSLREMIERLCHADQAGGEVSLAALMQAAGQRSFGPLLLLPGLIALSPLTGIPGVPTLCGVMVLLITVQLLARRRHFWLPQWMLRRRISYRRLRRALGLLHPVAKVTDRLLRERLTPLVNHAGAYAVAVICALIGLSMPVMEVLPFAATIAGAAISLFAVALVVRDGLVMLLALTLSVAGAGFFLRTLL